MNRQQVMQVGGGLRAQVLFDFSGLGARLYVDP
jgi:hypothetical protein